MEPAAEQLRQRKGANAQLSELHQQRRQRLDAKQPRLSSPRSAVATGRLRRLLPASLAIATISFALGAFLHRAIMTVPPPAPPIEQARVSAAVLPPDASVAHVSSDPVLLRLMTFNLRYGSAWDGENSWQHRRTHVANLINRYHPAVMATQEGEEPQLAELQALLPGYERFGKPRKPENEHTQIFYDASVVELLDGDTFWLSETPHVPQSWSWDTSMVRIATWCRFRLRCTGQQLVVVNTHLDHQGAVAQLEGSRTIWSVVQKIVEQHGHPPLFLMGDFNVNRGSRVYDFLTKHHDGPLFSDAWRAAEHRIGDVANTYHEWIGPAYDATTPPPPTTEPLSGHEHIDWIFARPALPVTVAQVVTESLNGRFPSDHYPIVADFLVPPPRRPTTGLG
ncbi:hypothetical protein P43SY_004191 [Pythium insidiosum]|uniref:Endonuclease/exonuclease/phosphatase domain-containing protein n=1 Tax=Pythium insidiosum TaxID=114742 RepID=A0AAD5LW58_PYTIN|nr:hypothetical protein P43SY_004191 [Pythium insidiosum]